MADKKQENPQTKKSVIKKPKFNFYWIYGILAVIFIGLQFLNLGSDTQKTDWRGLKIMLEDGHIDRITLVNKEKAEIYIRKENLDEQKYEDVRGGGGFGSQGPNYVYTINSPDKFEEKVDAAQKNNVDKIYIDSETRRNWGGEVIGWIFPILILVVVSFSY